MQILPGFSAQLKQRIAKVTGKIWGGLLWFYDFLPLLTESSTIDTDGCVTARLYEEVPLRVISEQSY